MRTAIFVAVLLIWTFSGLYLGIAGFARASMDESLNEIQSKKETLIKETFKPIEVGGIEVDNQYDLQWLLERQVVDELFPWTLTLSSIVSLMITALSFGQLGAVIAILKMIAFDRRPLNSIPLYSLPLLGLLSGLVVYGVVMLLPTILAEGVPKTRPLALMFLCLFAGIFLEPFYAKVNTYFNKIFL